VSSDPEISYELQICCGSREEFNPEAHVSLDLELALTNDNDAIKKELRRIGMAALADKKQFKNNTPWSVVTHQDKNAAIGGKLSMYLNNIDRISRRKGTVGELGEQAAGALALYDGGDWNEDDCSGESSGSENTVVDGEVVPKDSVRIQIPPPTLKWLE
jgi:hypothetical protein